MIRLLDTNVVIAAIRGWPASVRERVKAAHPDDVAAVVTANRREFERVPGLVVEDWSG